jgi:hypothetical protein
VGYSGNGRRQLPDANYSEWREHHSLGELRNAAASYRVILARELSSHDCVRDEVRAGLYVTLGAVCGEIALL